MDLEPEHKGEVVYLPGCAPEDQVFRPRLRDAFPLTPPEVREHQMIADLVNFIECRREGLTRFQLQGILTAVKDWAKYNT